MPLMVKRPEAELSHQSTANPHQASSLFFCSPSQVGHRGPLDNLEGTIVSSIFLHLRFIYIYMYLRGILIFNI